VTQHLYIHVPFCVRRCSYCDFSIAVRKRIPAQEYVDVVGRELEWAQLDENLETIYLGGGTPSLLPPETIHALLFRVPRSTFPVEVSLEANPEDVTPTNARAWASAGVNRVSLGAQSFDDRVLQWMHRSHTAARIGEAVGMLRAAGIDNISLDLIFGLPEELPRDWGRDLDQLCSLLPAHCSLYGLTVEPRTPLDRWISRGAVQAPEEGRYVDEYLEAHERLAGAGYQFYEVSNAALPGRQSRHNSAYWSGRPYVGLGPAAHSFDGRTRRWNLAAWEAYRRAVAEGRSPLEAEETLTDEQRDLESLYLGLRTSAGIPLGRLPPSFGDRWVRAGWVTVHESRLTCTPHGWLRLDSLVQELTKQGTPQLP
jgi:oxygen-independent coproporphyrinogen-3 oxidase